MNSSHQALDDVQSLLRSTPSLLGARIAQLDDLRPGLVAMAGVFCDHFSDGQPGARFAPRQLRYHASDALRRTARCADLVDISDLNVFPLQPARNANILAEQSEKIAATGAKLLAIGGDYSITPHLVEGMKRARGTCRIGLIRLSRRIDCLQPNGSFTRSSASVRINDVLGGVRADMLFAGAESPLGSEEIANAAGATIITMNTLRTQGSASLHAATEALLSRCDGVYLSVDADILAPLYGETSVTHSGPGLAPANLIALLDQLVDVPVLGADMVGHVPNLDLAGGASTSMLSSVARRIADLLRVER